MRSNKRTFSPLAARRRTMQGTPRIIAAITEVRVMKKILWHVKLAVDPPPIAPA